MQQEEKQKAKPKYQDGQVLSINYTPEGPVRVIWREGKDGEPGRQFVQSPETDPNPEVPGGITDRELREFYNFCALSKQLLTADDRKVPVMLQEAEQILPKPTIKKLSRKGLIDIQTLQIVNDDNKKQSFAFCWLTALGRGIQIQIETAAETFRKEVADEIVMAPEQAP